jgi:lipopolysaccharide export system permease protein
MTLARYIVRRFAVSVGIVFLIFFGMMVLIDMVEHLRRFGGEGLTLAEAAELAFLNVPASLYRILPLIFIFGAIAMFLGLARSSELVVIRAAGRSGLRFLLIPVTAALVLGVLAVAVLNPVVAGTSREYDTLFARHARGVDSVLSVSGSGLWLRQGGEEGQTVIQAARANGDGTQLLGATFLTYGPDGTPLTRIEAEAAELGEGLWRLSNAKRWDLTAANPEAGAETAAAMTLTSDLTAARIRDSFGDPAAIPIWDLPEYIARIEKAGLSATAHRVWLQMELALPLLLTAMVLVAAGFTMRHTRAGRTGIMVLFAILGGFVMFFLRNFAQVLGDNGQIPVFLAAWSPPVAALLLSVALLLHVEDG